MLGKDDHFPFVVLLFLLDDDHGLLIFDFFLLHHRYRLLLEVFSLELDPLPRGSGDGRRAPPAAAAGLSLDIGGGALAGDPGGLDGGPRDGAADGGHVHAVLLLHVGVEDGLVLEDVGADVALEGLLVAVEGPVVSFSRRLCCPVK